MLDERAKTLLKALVERYIADGQPVGSRTLSRASGLELSPATIRNVMADLEDLGLIASPHTSAGRIPTARGYRLFVDTMLTAQPFASAAPDLKFAAAVAEFGMILRDSPHKGSGTLPEVRAWAEAGMGNDEGGYRGEFLELVQQAEALMQ